MVILLKKLQHLETQYIQGFRILHPCIEECQYSYFIQIKQNLLSFYIYDRRFSFISS